MKALTISKWGNSTAIRLPQAVLIKFNLREGDSLQLIEEDNLNHLTFRPVRQAAKRKIRHRYTLAELMPKSGRLAGDDEWDKMPPTNEEMM